jgi:hypothetical protein
MRAILFLVAVGLFGGCGEVPLLGIVDLRINATPCVSAPIPVAMLDAGLRSGASGSVR